MIRIIKYVSIPVFIAAVIFYLCCLIPANDIPAVEIDFFIPTDKIVHFLMYFGLSGATALFYIHDNDGHVDMKKIWIGAIIIPIMYGGAIEIIQDKFYPPRQGDWFDFLADTLGSLAALPFIYYYKNKLLKTEKVRS
ncbi:MAG: VanZ family protein [Dysgonomonas sp.]